MFNIARFAAIVATTVLTMHSQAESSISKDEIAAAQEYVQATIKPMFEPSNIRESEIPGFIEILFGSRIIYFHIESKLVFMGEFYTSEGESVTKRALSKLAADRYRSLTDKRALVINENPMGQKIVEITDPDCPYCRKAQSYFTDHDLGVERHVYFDIRNHPAAKQKAIHILCAKDPASEFSAVYQNKVSDYQYCKDGEAELNRHAEIIKSLGTSGTPSFLIGDQLVSGFDKARIEQLIKPARQ